MKTIWITNEAVNTGACAVWDVEPNMGKQGFFAKGRTYIGMIPNGTPIFGYIPAGHCVEFEIRKADEI
jgi:hypothetical protein